jgi:type III secretion system YscQ/HrcQ family protein
MTTDYRPYPWERLEQLTRAEAELGDRAARWVPGARESRWATAFEDFWAELVGERYTVEALGFTTYGTGRFAAPAGDLVVTEFTFPPLRSAGVVAVDRALAQSWLDVVVGPSPAARRLVELDDRDRTVLVYLALRAAEFFTQRGSPPAVVATERIGPDEAFARLARQSGVTEIDFVFSSASNTALVRVYLPASMMATFDAWATRRRPVSKFVGEFMVHARASLAHQHLTPIEIANLAPGDVVFMSADPLANDSASLIIGGRAVAASAVAQPEHDSWTFTVAPGGNESEIAMEDMMAAPDEVTSQLVDSVELRMDVVVGNVSLSVSELSRLQPGRVFVLDGAVGEPVDLVVNDHVVAKGELVDVDGRVGVRVLALGGR